MSMHQRLRDLINPGFDFGGLVRILFSGLLDPRLQLAERDGGQVQVFVGNAFEPCDHGSVRPWAPQYRDDVRIEEVQGPTRRPPAPAGANAAERERECRPAATLRAASP